MALNSVGLVLGLLLLFWALGALTGRGEQWGLLAVPLLGVRCLLGELFLLATSFLVIALASSLSPRFQSVLMGLIVAGVIANGVAIGLTTFPILLVGPGVLLAVFLLFALARSLSRRVRLALMGTVIGATVVAGSAFSLFSMAAVQKVQRMFAIDPGNGPSELLPGEVESFLSEALRRKDRQLISAIVRDSQLSRDTALQYAARQGNVEMARYLIDQGARVDAKDDRGMTPMLRAIRFSKLHESGSLEVVKLLVENGSDLSIRSPDGLTMLEYAQVHGASSVQGYLSRRQADPVR